MAKVYQTGLEAIYIGDIAADGSMGTNLEQYGCTMEDTCTFEQEAPTDTEFYCEEHDDPEIVISKNGKINFAFDLMDADLPVMQKLFGGTIDEEAGKWEMPEKVTSIEKSVRIFPDNGFVYEVPRMRLTPRIVGGFGKTSLGKISISGQVLSPTKEGVSRLTWIRKEKYLANFSK